jgi:hypothetical protein
LVPSHSLERAKAKLHGRKHRLVDLALTLLSKPEQYISNAGIFAADDQQAELGEQYYR